MTWINGLDGLWLVQGIVISSTDDVIFLNIDIAEKSIHKKMCQIFSVDVYKCQNLLCVQPHPGPL
ncbi:MAG: hypothetical protein DRR08_18425 [Candidatus Parabeggiatoa sp. nov. 2]|nr:MAG: hypothetical protein B6247_19215 [Beggiatoa sp. 4572_84]RKZ57656.1 MAG: hypothetical protein DRR08_18425 [Gammaproteobacteria bacterium]